MVDRRPTCRVVDVDGQAVLVHGTGTPTPRELALIADFAAFLTVNAGPPGGPLSAVCGSCDASIVWATLPSGKLMPLDATPTPDGNIAARRLDNGDLQARVLKAGEEPAEDERRGTSHFQTCVNAAQHRQRRT
jgi:hypothetical protein